MLRSGNGVSNFQVPSWMFFVLLLPFLYWTFLLIAKAGGGSETWLDMFFLLEQCDRDLKFYGYVLKNLDDQIKYTEQLLQFY